MSRVLCLVFGLLLAEYPSNADAKACYDCNNQLKSADPTLCPNDGDVDSTRVYKKSCVGSCFKRTHINDTNVVYRGCADGHWGLPSPMPDDGCYLHQGVTWCICEDDLCNGGPMGNSSSIPLDLHLTGPKNCFVCGKVANDGKYYPYCEADTMINTTLAGTEVCDGHCLTRTDAGHMNKTYRGCMDSISDLPQPLPEDGCYPYKEETWCICLGIECNKDPLGEPGDVEMDEHVQGLHLCHSCRNYEKDTYYAHCPKDAKADITKTYKTNCTGKCFTRTDDLDDKLVYRGCMDSQFGLPDPLPPDGCYPYYLETWCVCEGNLCNGAALGEPGEVELDAHLYSGSTTTLFDKILFGIIVVLTAVVL